MKIIQIVATPDIECWQEIPGMVQTSDQTIYGLGDDGNLYIWSRRRFDLVNPYEFVDDEDGQKKVQSHIFLNGWVLLEDSIALKKKEEIIK